MTERARTPLVVFLAATASMLPLFTVTHDDSWIVPAAVAAALVVATGYVLRRLRTAGLLVVLAQLGVMVLWLGLIVAGDVAWLGVIPNTDWAKRIVDVAAGGVDTMTTYAAPVPLTTGMLLYLVGGTALVVVLVEVASTVFRSVVIGGLPLATGYAVSAAIVGGGLDWWWFIPPAVGYLALLVTDSRVRVATWGRSAGPSAAHSGVPETASLVRSGRRVGAVALTSALVVPALVPALTMGLLDGDGGGPGGNTIRTDNPIVDLQRNLTRPDNVEILSYSSEPNKGQYMRSVVLDIFDGEQWRVSNRDVGDQPVSEGLTAPPGLRIEDVALVEYNVAVTENYVSKWLPMPYPAQQVDIDGDWLFDKLSLDVVARDDDVDARGKAYTVRSLDVEPTAEQLSAAGGYGATLSPMTDLPDDLPAEVADTAAEVTAAATDDFGRAAALQRWFRRDGGFEYDVTTPAGTSSDALLDFLDGKRGYCEQFAATMAIMARTLDIPARVAVGFTPGTFTNGERWVVRAHNYHAWPELYFEGVGWTRFEPTPNVAVAPDWTVPPRADTAPDDSGNPVPVPAPSNSAGADGLRDDRSGAAGGGSGNDYSALSTILVVAVAAALLVSLPRGLARAGERLRRRRAGDDPRSRAEAAWADLRGSSRELGLPWDAGATPRRIGAALASAARLEGGDREALDRVVTTVERARYSRSSRPTASLDADVGTVRTALARQSSRVQRVRAYLWPATISEALDAASGWIGDTFDRLDAVSERLRVALTRMVRAGR